MIEEKKYLKIKDRDVLSQLEHDHEMVMEELAESLRKYFSYDELLKIKECVYNMKFDLMKIPLRDENIKLISHSYHKIEILIDKLEKITSWL